MESFLLKRPNLTKNSVTRAIKVAPENKADRIKEGHDLLDLWSISVHSTSQCPSGGHYCLVFGNICRYFRLVNASNRIS